MCMTEAMGSVVVATGLVVAAATDVAVAATG